MIAYFLKLNWLIFNFYGKNQKKQQKRKRVVSREKASKSIFPNFFFL